ncbi:hypothetical protein pb186bvf_015566 [Paramecium bursaria]
MLSYQEIILHLFSDLRFFSVDEKKKKYKLFLKIIKYKYSLLKLLQKKFHCINLIFVRHFLSRDQYLQSFSGCCLNIGETRDLSCIFSELQFQHSPLFLFPCSIEIIIMTNMNLLTNIQNTFYLLQILVVPYKIYFSFDLQTIREINMNQQQTLINNDELLYQDYYVEKITNNINTIQISNNEQYLAYGGTDRKVTLMDLKLKSCIRNPIILNNSVRVCKFSQDFQFIYFGDDFGNLYCYNVNKFMKKFKSRILQDAIQNIKPINNQQIIIKSYNAIKIYSMNNKKLLSTHYLDQSQFIFGLDFDQQNQIIITGEDDNQIVFLKRQDGKKLMTRPSFHDSPIKQLIMLNGKQLLSRSDKQIILYKIDYDNLQLAVISNYTLSYGCFYNFSPALNETRFVAMRIYSIIVLDQNLNQLQKIEIGEPISLNLNMDCLTQQIDSLNYLIIPFQQKIKVLKRVIDQEEKE